MTKLAEYYFGFFIESDPYVLSPSEREEYETEPADEVLVNMMTGEDDDLFSMTKREAIVLAYRLLLAAEWK